MMFMSRHGGGRRLRAFALASTIALAAGGVALAARAETPPVSAAQAAFASDRLSVEVIGTGPDVILIPGLLSSREVWRPLADRLAKTHRVHLVQLAGFAGEPWNHGDGAFVVPVVEELGRYVVEAGLDHPAVIGHSMGALIGLKLAQDRPDSVGRLLSVDSLPFYSVLYGPTTTVESMRPAAERMAAAFAAMDDASFAAGQAQIATASTRAPEVQAAILQWSVASDRRGAGAAFRDVMLTDTRPALPAMTLPVTAIYAADAEGGTPAAMADALWAQEYAPLPGVRLIRVDGSRHFIMADQPETFAEIVDQFLAD